MRTIRSGIPNKNTHVDRLLAKRWSWIARMTATTFSGRIRTSLPLREAVDCFGAAIASRTSNVATRYATRVLSKYTGGVNAARVTAVIRSGRLYLSPESQDGSLSQSEDCAHHPPA